MKHRIILLAAMCAILAIYGHANTLILPERAQAEHAQTQPVLVSGKGRNAEEAINNALKVAVERVVGTLITSEVYIKNGELIDEQILKASLSYVVSYELLFESDADGSYRVTIEADVAKRKLAGKLSSINVAVLEVEDSALAHSQLLASISDYTNNIENIKRAFKRTFGNVNSLFTITVRDVHFYTADVKDGKVPVSVLFDVAIDPEKYEARRALIAKVLVEDIGAVETKELFKYKFIVDNSTQFLQHNWHDMKSEYSKDYRLLMMRKKGNDYVFDAYDMRDLPEEMRKFAYIQGVSERQLFDGIWDDYVHVLFRDSGGKVVFEDYVMMMTREFIHQGNRKVPQTNLSIVWESPIVPLDRTYPLMEYGDDVRSMMNCAMVYGRGGDCVQFERSSFLPGPDMKMIMPFFAYKLGMESGFYLGRSFSDTVTFEYMAYIPLDKVDSLADVLVETLEIPAGDRE